MRHTYNNHIGTQQPLLSATRVPVTEYLQALKDRTFRAFLYWETLGVPSAKMTLRYRYSVTGTPSPLRGVLILHRCLVTRVEHQNASLPHPLPSAKLSYTKGALGLRIVPKLGICRSNTWKPLQTFANLRKP